MFFSHRTVDLPVPNGASALLATHAVVHSGYRVHAVFRDNVVSEDALLVRGFDRRGALGRPIATVLLEGRARLRVPGHERTLEPGELCVAASKIDILMRQEGPRYRSMVWEWEPGAWGERPPEPLAVRRVPEATCAALTALAEALRDQPGEASQVADAIAEGWASLRALGVPLVEVDGARLVEPVSEPTLRLARALDALQSNLRGVPMMTDLERALRLSVRQINRLVQEYNERYGFNASGWRDTRNRWRLMMGATLMTAPGATPDAVARAVGFASAATFSRALANVGLPPPGEIAAAVRALAPDQDQAP
jgi:AraC-like DNA-binding protein